MMQANNCELAIAPAETPSAEASWMRLALFVREHHAYVLSHADTDGHFAYDWYPHHLWSNPFLYRDFADLDKRRIVAYEFTTDYVCVGYDEQGLSRRIHGTDSRIIDIR